jgi:hypothetical protein
MTQALVLPTFRSRLEGDHHVVFVPDTDSYFVVNQVALDILDRLREGDSAADAAERVVGAAMAPAESVLIIEDLVRILQGEAASPIVGQISIKRLSEVIGDAAQRCETFGMPL